MQQVRNECLTIFQNEVPSPVTVQMLQRSRVTGSCPPPPPPQKKIEKRDCACLISNFRNVSLALHTNPLQSSIVKYNKNETCGNLLLNKNLKGKACRSYDGEVMPFLKLPPPPPPPPPVTGKRSIAGYSTALMQRCNLSQKLKYPSVLVSGTRPDHAKDINVSTRVTWVDDGRQLRLCCLPLTMQTGQLK